MSDDTPRLSEYAEVEQGVIKIDASEINQTIAIPATPNNELRELVEEWREADNVLDANDPKQYGKYECADELEELL